jgi:hypothetical protein
LQQVANNKTDDYIVEVVDNLIRLPKISEADLDKAEREIRALEMLACLTKIPNPGFTCMLFQEVSVILKSRISY